jgi:dolichyl-phosphate beta-glucosyltransferase
LSALVELSIIMPAFNEAARIAKSVHTLRNFLDQHVRRWEVRIVDDGSQDGTSDIARDIGSGDARVVVQCEPHRGKGAAVRSGMLAAHAKQCFMCDVDLSMPVTEIPRFLEAGRNSEIVIGVREGPGAIRVGEPAYRHVMGRAFNLLVRSLAAVDFADTQCGYKLFSKRAVDVVFRRSRLDGWAFDVEALQIARRHGLTIAELPIEWHFGERSQISPLMDSFRMARDVLTVFRNTRRGCYD